MIKLIASDMDGTLLQNGQRRVSAEMLAMIPRLRERGILFVAASGRQYPSLRIQFAPVWKEMAFLAENGCLIMHHGEVLHKSEIPRETGLALLEDIVSLGCEPVFSGMHTIYMRPVREYVEMMLRVYGYTVTVLDELTEMDEPFLKISLYCPQGAVNVIGPFAEKWGERLQVAVSGEGWIDCTMSNKGEGLRLLQERFGLAKDELMAFGDNYNDTQMLETVGHPYLMETADAPLLERFPQHCHRVEDVLSNLLKNGL